LAKYNLDLLAAQQVRWVESGSQSADYYTFFRGNENPNYYLGTGFFIHKGIISAAKRAEFISYRMMYITLRGSSCDIFVLKVQVSRIKVTIQRTASKRT
jgi:hypothetical protein